MQLLVTSRRVKSHLVLPPTLESHLVINFEGEKQNNTQIPFVCWRAAMDTCEECWIWIGSSSQNKWQNLPIFTWVNHGAFLGSNISADRAGTFEFDLGWKQKGHSVGKVQNQEPPLLLNDGLEIVVRTRTPQYPGSRTFFLRKRTT